MRTSTALGVAGLATIAAIAVPSAAAAHQAATPKPSGTIFFFREKPGGGAQNAYEMTAAGKSAHKVPHVQVDFPVYPASKAHLLAYTISTGNFARAMRVASYAGKVKHKYSPKGLIFVNSVSPNGKYIGDELSHGAGAVTYNIATIKGKTIAKLFSVGNNNPQIEESWSANGKQLVVLNATSTAPVKSTLKIYNLHGKLVRTLVKNAGASFSVSWSKSGNIAYSQVHTISVIRATGGKPKILLNAGANFPDGGLSYSPNGAYLAYGLNLVSNAEQIWRINAGGGSPHKITGNGTQPWWG